MFTPALSFISDDYQNQFPTDLSQVDLNYFGSSNLMEFAQHNAELVNAHTSNLKNYPQAILVREWIPRQDADGKWERAYGLVDGSVQTAKSDDGNFDEWEKQHTFTPPQNQ